MSREINPKDTTRDIAFDLWMKAPNPMVTFFKTLDVTNLVKLSKKKLNHNPEEKPIYIPNGIFKKWKS